MNEMKRALSFNQSFNIPSKKLRTACKEETVSSTCLEHFSNELLYEIFDYLDAYDIYKAFSNLNIRFRNLFTHSNLSLKVGFSAKSQSTIEHCCRNVVIPEKHRIRSLHYDSPGTINKFFSHCNIDSSFNRLESIVLNGVSDHKLFLILFFLQSLPKLSSLSMQLEEDSYYNMSDIYRLIFHLPSLKFNKISLSDYDESDVLIPISINNKFSTIEHLVVDLCCSLNEIMSILYHTPDLRYLSCRRLVETHESDEKEVLLTLSKLIHVSFSECDIDFDMFEVFIKKISAHLQVLRLQSSFDVAYLNADRWKQLIKKHIPRLRIFHFDYHECADEVFEMIPKYESISQFTSTFWIERQWFFEFKNGSSQLTYSVHPYKYVRKGSIDSKKLFSFRKNWFDSCEHKQTIDQYTFKVNQASRSKDNGTGFIPFAQLTMEEYSSDTWNSEYFDAIKRCFSATQFTHLNINCQDIPVGILIEIIRLLPSVNSLEVSSMPDVQLSCLSTEDAEMLLLVSITNKITKVKLNKIYGMEQVSFLMNLCPRMQYFEVEFTTKDDLENIVGSISVNNTTCIPHLCCLSLCAPHVNEKIIQNLHVNIDFQRLFRVDDAFRDYVVRLVGNKIFLTWKL